MKITSTEIPEAGTGGCCPETNDLLTEIVNSLDKNTSIYYNEVLSVAASVLTNIITHTALIDESLQSIIVSGTNIAEYTISINAGVIVKIRTEFTSLNEIIPFPERGLKILIGDVITVDVVHVRPFLGDFNATLKIDN